MSTCRTSLAPPAGADGTPAPAVPDIASPPARRSRPAGTASGGDHGPGSRRGAGDRGTAGEAGSAAASPAVQARPTAPAGQNRQHGTSARYAWGPDQNGTPGAGCRCSPCTAQRREERARRERLKAYGRWKPYVDAGPAREHLIMLSGYGIGLKHAAALAGISQGSAAKLLYGGPGSRPPARSIRPETEARILAVRPDPALLAPSAPVDATGTRRRLRALVAAGWSQQKLAARLAMTGGNFAAVMHRDRVTAATARAVLVLYRDLWDTPPPEDTHRDKIAASRSRNRAAVRGWPLPAAWDDDLIDDPAAVPAEGWQRGPDAPLRGAALALEARDLASLGVTGQHAADRLRVTPGALRSALRDHPPQPGQQPAGPPPGDPGKETAA